VTARTAFIIGNGGHAHVIASLLPHDTIRFLVTESPSAGEALQDDVLASRPGDADFFIGIGDDAVRRRYFDRLDALGAPMPPCVAQHAFVAGDARLGRGVFIGPGAVVASRAKLADNVIVNTLAAVDHDSDVGEDSQVTPGVSLGSRLTIGRRCYFGMKSCVLPRLSLGDRTIVMAGALVVRSSPGGVMLGGSPARVMRPVNEASAPLG
jgi:UDP-N-acetylbacillosamine N-acetyltransferase